MIISDKPFLSLQISNTMHLKINTSKNTNLPTMEMEKQTKELKASFLRPVNIAKNADGTISQNQ